MEVEQINTEQSFISCCLSIYSFRAYYIYIDDMNVYLSVSVSCLIFLAGGWFCIHVTGVYDVSLYSTSVHISPDHFIIYIITYHPCQAFQFWLSLSPTFLLIVFFAFYSCIFLCNKAKALTN